MVANAGKWLLVAILLLPAAEFFAFLAVISQIGLLPTVLLTMLTSFLGFLLLRMGQGSGGGLFQRSAMRLSPGAAVRLSAGVLLLLPGFITDALGAALLLPPVRRVLAKRLFASKQAPRRTPTGGRVLDLEPQEWKKLPDESAASERSNPGKQQ